MYRPVAAAAVAAALIAPAALHAQARDNIRIVGSSTVYPFTTTVAENFSRNNDFPAPVVESTGTGGGFQVFCEGVGEQYPDINNASRAMTDGERELCASNGVDGVTEIQIGNDGIVLATDKSVEPIAITTAQIWQALAAESVQDGEVVENPYLNWSDIDDSLPDVEIAVFGPPPTSGTRDAFVELAMEAGCESFDAVTSLEEDRMDEVCTTMRTDGGFIEAGENDNVIVQRVQSQQGAVGIFGYSFYEQNKAALQAASIDDSMPEPEAIQGDDYPLARPLFIYVKDQHVGAIPGLQEYLDYYTSAESWGPDGFLLEEGLIPMTEGKREEIGGMVESLGS